MPIYEFECPSCGKEFEELVPSKSAVRSVACPKCGAKDAKRRMSVFAAREGSRSKTGSPASACGRCGDPNGPCMN